MVQEPARSLASHDFTSISIAGIDSHMMFHHIVGRRVVCKVEKPENQMVYMYTFVVTNMDSAPEYLIKFYCKRGLMENFIKESKTGFDFASVSSHTRIVNANRILVHALAYNIFNWFRRLALSANMRKQRIDTVRLKLLKIAAKAVH